MPASAARAEDAVVDGDGTRAVNDLLTLLSSFGCVSNCAGDNDGDGSVAVGDLMNMLSVYGTDCD